MATQRGDKLIHRIACLLLRTCLIPHLLNLLSDLLAGILNLLLSSQEDKDVTGGLTHVNLDYCPDGCF